MEKVLAKIGKMLNDENITWAVGASLLLKAYSMVESVGDIDLLVSEKDVKKVDALLKEVGVAKDMSDVRLFGNEFFGKYAVDNVDIDIMSGLVLSHQEGVFSYVFDKQSITCFVTLEGIKIPYTSLEDWYVIYQLLENREKKVKMIEEYLMKNGVKNMHLLLRSKEGNLPQHIVKNIDGVLDNHMSKW